MSYPLIDFQVFMPNTIRTNISPSTMGLFDVIAETRNGKIVIKVTIASMFTVTRFRF